MSRFFFQTLVIFQDYRMSFATSHIASHLEALHKTKEETGDFELNCQGKVVKAHSFILSMRYILI